jgi:hypothetical protein
VEHLEDVVRWRAGDNRGGYNLIHRFVIVGVSWVMDEAGAAAVDACETISTTDVRKG